MGNLVQRCNQAVKISFLRSVGEREARCNFEDSVGQAVSLPPSVQSPLPEQNLDKHRPSRNCNYVRMRVTQPSKQFQTDRSRPLLRLRISSLHRGEKGPNAPQVVRADARHRPSKERPKGRFSHKMIPAARGLKFNCGLPGIPLTMPSESLPVFLPWTLSDRP
jgi:hypothetical protein